MSRCFLSYEEAVAFCEAEIRIDRFWEEKKQRLFQRLSWVNKAPIPDNLKEINGEIQYRIATGEWHYQTQKRNSEEFWKKHFKEMRERFLANPPYLFTQNCTCGAVFQGPDGDKVAEIWREHVSRGHQ